MQEFYDKLREAYATLGMSLTDRQAEDLAIFYEMLIQTNKVMNLTAITDMDEVIYKHFIDSSCLVRVVPDIYEKPYRLIDVGTGAGFPGMVLAILNRDLQIVLMDSLAKRVRFLESVISRLGLSYVSAIHARAEELARDDSHREMYDICTSRAVANLQVLSEYSIPFVKVGGLFVAYKSREVDEELGAARRAIDVLGARVKACEHFSLGREMGERSLLVIEKERSTADKYPRVAGAIGKKPL